MIISRTWDQVGLINFKLVNKNNIFKEGTFENMLVEQLIEFYEKNEKELLKNIHPKYKYHFENLLSAQILDYLGKNKIAVPMDCISKNHLGQKACWYARLSGCIEAKKITDSYTKVPLFGLYLESGILDLLKESELMGRLIKTSPTEDGLKHLIHVAKISSTFRQLFDLPTVDFDQESLKKNRHKRYQDITIKNFNVKDTQSLNFQTWPDIENLEVAAKTRGIYHHLGDDIAFMLSAIEYGDFCILGADEFGDIIPMYYYSYNEMNVKKFTERVVFSWEDFDYIYGVPRINSLYPSQNNIVFQYATENRDQCLINDKDNATLAEAFWNNDVFQRLAGRKIETKTLGQLSQEFKNCVESAFSNYREHDFFKNNDSVFSYFLKKMQEKSCAVDSADEVDFFNHVDGFIRKNFSFFMKTTAHKVNCAVINPEENTEMAFFKKSGDKKESRYLDLSAMFKFFITQKQEEITQGLNTDFYQRIFINFLLGETPNGFWEREDKHLYNYWLELDNKSFVVSELVEMRHEYRIFIINGKIAATSACYRNTTPFNAWTKGRIDPRLCDGHNATELIYNERSRAIAAKYARFARKFIAEMKAEHPKVLSYVLDVCLSYDKNGNEVIIPIEVNSINMSGAYQIDMRKVCAAVAGKSSNISSLNNLFDLDFLNSNPVEFIQDKAFNYAIHESKVIDVLHDVYELQEQAINDLLNARDKSKGLNENDVDLSFDDEFSEESEYSEESALDYEFIDDNQSKAKDVKSEDDTVVNKQKSEFFADDNLIINLDNQNKNEKM